MSELNFLHSGGNKVTLTTPDTLAANKTFKLPNADGSAGQVLKTDGSGALSFASAGNTNPLQVLEEFQVSVDGTAITTSKGSVSIGNVTTAQTLTTTLSDLTGSSISYQPPDNTKIVIYSYNFAGFHADNDPICYGFIYLDDVAVTGHPFTERAGYNIRRTTWSHAFRIEPSLSANAATGRVQSWNSAKTIKIKVRDHSTNYDAIVHRLVNASNSGGTNVSNVVVTPTIGIRAIGSV